MSQLRIIRLSLKLDNLVEGAMHSSDDTASALDPVVIHAVYKDSRWLDLDLDQYSSLLLMPSSFKFVASSDVLKPCVDIPQFKPIALFVPIVGLFQTVSHVNRFTAALTWL